MNRRAKALLLVWLIPALSFLALAGAAYGVWAADPAMPAYRQKLDPATMQQIQATGQAVLLAKKSRPVDPEMADLKKRVENLRDTIISFQGPFIRAGESPKISLSTNNAISPASSIQQAQQKTRQQADSRLRGALEAVRTQTSVVQQRAPQAASGEQMALRQGAAAMVQELEAEVEAALQSPPDDRAAKIARLRERLTTTHRLREPGAEMTPTISTITQHRVQ